MPGKHISLQTRIRKALFITAWHLFASLPNRCLLCHQSLARVIPSNATLIDSLKAFKQGHQTGICDTCLNACLYQGDICLGCGKRISIPACFCGHCLGITPMKIIAPCSYHQGLGPLVAGIKYQQQLAPLTVLVNALVARIQALVAIGFIRLPQVLLPVPLHAKRLKARGFNQAWLIAKELSCQLNIPIDEDYLYRVEDTQPQAGMTGKQRRKNCHQAFKIRGNNKYQRVVIVDDVVTTGTTTNEINKLLLKKGIYADVWCLARAEAPGLMN
jgi:ComF family protein